MKQLTVAVVTLGVVGMMAGPALAGSSSSADTRGTSHTSFTTSQVGYEAQHTMTGTVTSIDRKTGRLSLKTDEGKLMLHFPPSKVQNITDGERVTVELGIKPDTLPSASPSSSSTSTKK
jgi:hypothetical protein